MTLAAVNSPADVTSALVVPHGTQGSYIDAQRDECGLLIATALDVVRMLTGRDLFRELLEPIAGDFDAVSAMQQGWLHLADAAAGVERNWTRLDRSLGSTWRGVAADRASAALHASASRQDSQSRACALISEQLGHMIEVARATTETVVAALRYIDSLLLECLLNAALGPLGAAKALIQAKTKVHRLISLIDRAAAAVQGLVRAATALTAALRQVQALLDGLRKAAGVANDVGHVAAGSWVDETARAGFAP